MMAATTHSTYSTTGTLRIGAGNGIEYAYREVGDGETALVLLQHFRGNLDNWDPALIDALATRTARRHLRQRRRRRL